MAHFDMDTHTQAPLEFDDWADLYSQLGVSESPAELHGVLTGGLCAGAELAPADWLRVVTEHVGMGLHDEANRDLRQQFEGLYQDVTRSFRRDLISFAPLLPDDLLPLTQRLEALGSWCLGFVEGLSRGLKSRQPNLSAESRELLTDLMAIAEIDTQTDGADDQEHDYAELVEFVRVAVINLADEFGQTMTPPAGSSIH